MCWESKTLPVKNIAEENIEIFKICTLYDYEIHAYFNADFVYTLDKVYEQKKLIMYERHILYQGYFVEEAFHSYSNSCLIYWLDFNTISINGTRYIGPYLIKVKGYIPKGAIYYINEIGEIVSDKIVLTDYIEI